MSVLEIVMLVCFGSAWPFSIHRSYVSRSNKGKSVAFLAILFVGYVAGFFHKVVNDFDLVTYLYLANGLMVLIDTVLYFRNAQLQSAAVQTSA